MTKLTLTDIVDLRAYERERDALRKNIIDLKKVRRVPIGNLATLVFENRETIRFQIQEMARAEKMIRDEQIETELNIYNPLIPTFGELKATLFLELTDQEMLQKWLPALVGVETSVYLRLGDSEDSPVLLSRSDEDHLSQLTRPDVTSSVHYVWWKLEGELIERFKRSPVYLGIDHVNYKAEVNLSRDLVESLVSDWS